MTRILVFAHMMKTAGTSLSKQLIYQFGSRMHMVPGGSDLDHDFYGQEQFSRDLQKMKGNMAIITGHAMRPYRSYGPQEDHMRWFTFLRDPTKRYLSHYFHMKEWTNNCSYRRYRDMAEDSITEWEKVDQNSNYQTRFIAGEPNADMAIERLEEKMSWVGLTEHWEDAMCSLKQHFDLTGLSVAQDITNRSLSQSEEREEVMDKYGAFIQKVNREDQKLYTYVKEHVWPRYKPTNQQRAQYFGRKDNPVARQLFNVVSYQVNRQLKFGATEFNWKNVKRCYWRWLR